MSLKEILDVSNALVEVYLIQLQELSSGDLEWADHRLSNSSFTPYTLPDRL